MSPLTHMRRAIDLLKTTYQVSQRAGGCEQETLETLEEAKRNVEAAIKLLKERA